MNAADAAGSSAPLAAAPEPERPEGVPPLRLERLGGGGTPQLAPPRMQPGGFGNQLQPLPGLAGFSGALPDGGPLLPPRGPPSMIRSESGVSAGTSAPSELSEWPSELFAGGGSPLPGALGDLVAGSLSPREVEMEMQAL